MSGLETAMVPVLQALLSGVLVGGVYGLLSIGLSLAFGVMRIVNFAHGDMVMYGMYVGVVASAAFGIDPLYALPASFVLMGILGALQYRIVFRRFVGHTTLNQLLAAIGLGLALQMVAQLVFGVDARSATSIFAGKYDLIGPFFFARAQIVAFALAGIATILVELLLRKTQWGKAVRAVADNIEAAEIVGLRSQRINLMAFALSCALASIGGAVLGGIFCGVIQQMTAMLWNSALQDVPLYILLLAFIAYRPMGLFG